MTSLPDYVIPVRTGPGGQAGGRTGKTQSGGLTDVCMCYKRLYEFRGTENQGNKESDRFGFVFWVQVLTSYVQ